MNIRACRGCRYFHKYYGNRDARGKPAVSNEWCIAKNGFIKRFPKQCKWREDKM